MTWWQKLTAVLASLFRGAGIRGKILWSAIRLAAWPAVQSLFGRLRARASVTKKTVYARSERFWRRIAARRLQYLVLLGSVLISAVIFWGVGTIIPRINWFVVVVVLAILAAAGGIGFALRKQEAREKAWEYRKHLAHPLFIGFLGLLVFHWLFWALNEQAWLAWWRWKAFLPMQLALVIGASLLVQKGPVRYLGQALVTLAVLAIAMGAYSYLWPSGFSWPSLAVAASPSVPTPAPPVRIATSDVTLAAIAQCESGGRQFEDDGVTPRRNPKLGSTAIGKYQIVESLHGDKAKALGFDLATEAGNESYAEHLYSEEGGKPWEASRSCWEARLVAQGYAVPAAPQIPGVNAVGTNTFSVKTGEPHQITVPPAHRWVLANPPTNGWTTDNGFRDAAGNRIQIFHVADGATETALTVTIEFCPACSWSGR